MSEDSRRPGDEHESEFTADFFDRLARYWPHLREQLHAGGWEMTCHFLPKLDIQDGEVVLDLCCGEGATACWLARNRAVEVWGVDIVQEAIDAATRRAAAECVQSRCRFVRANIFCLPFENGRFDVIYGQDPDGLAHAERRAAFDECHRVLRGGGRIGFHHWIPGLDAPAALVHRFDRANVDAGFPSHGQVHADAYVEAMRQAGFADVRVSDLSTWYVRHMRGVAERRRAAGAPLDRWTEICLELAETHPFGVAIFGRCGVRR